MLLQERLSNATQIKQAVLGTVFSTEDTETRLDAHWWTLRSQDLQVFSLKKLFKHTSAVLLLLNMSKALPILEIYLPFTIYSNISNTHNRSISMTNKTVRNAILMLQQ